MEKYRERLAAAGVEDVAAELEALLEAASTSLRDVEELVDQRAEGVPLAYITGWQRFLGIDMIAAPGALIPREETELLGHAALEIIAENFSSSAHVLDVCCGAGNLACAIAVKAAHAKVWASDLTDGCVTVAERNVAHHGLGERVAVHQGDLLGAFDGLGLEQEIDVIVANPPYISTKRLTEGDRSELLDHEPREAFDGGPYGLSIHQKLIKQAPSMLKSGGYLIFEFGLGQDRQVLALFKRAKVYEIDLLSDEEGNARVAVARRKSP